MNSSDQFVVQRVMLETDPFADSESLRGHWPAAWVGESVLADPDFQVTAYRLIFTLPNAATLRLHVSADERYELYIDGRFAGRGPERGDERNWFFETRDCTLPAGRHVIVARTWWLGPTAAPLAQHSIRPGFLLAAQGDGVTPDLLNTGKATWECKRLHGYATRPSGDAWGTGKKLRVDGSRRDRDVESGGGDGWMPVVKTNNAIAGTAFEIGRAPLLRPAVLPEMLNTPLNGITVRHACEVPSLDELFRRPVLSRDHRAPIAAAWQSLLDGGAPVTVEAKSRVRIILDARNYVCAYPHLRTLGGRGAIVKIFWVESLTESLPAEKGWIHAQKKGDRDAIEGKFFYGQPYGVGDEFLPGGGNEIQSFATMWWEAGRYVEVTVETAGEPLEIESLRFHRTGYPYEFSGGFNASDMTLAEIQSIAVRALEMCSHETYMDCPYFEQLQYIGDTRLQALVTYVTTHDSRLPRKAVELFDASRDPSGLTQSRYPSAHRQGIAPFSLWWVAMVHDYAMWRDEPGFVRARLPGVRAVLDAYAGHINKDGLLGPVPSWNYVDWVPAWKGGMPPGAADGVSGVLCWQYALALRMAAELEAAFGERELATLQHRRAAALAEATTRHFYCAQRGAMADDLAKSSWSEHAQCLALLAGLLPEPIAERVAATLVKGDDLHRATIYFSHYRFEALQRIGRAGMILDQMEPWLALLRDHLKTTVEMPEPTRSDCHAWGAHPVFHFHASVLGIRPGGFGFQTINVSPQLGRLEFVQARTPHPAGCIETDLRRDGAVVTGKIRLPDGLSGTYYDAGRRVAIYAGDNAL